MLVSRKARRVRANAARRTDALVALHARLRSLEDALVECELAWGEPDAEPLRRGTVKRWGNVAQTLGADVAGLLRM